ncbi:carboxypeptidase-like regulatory domain-containing protein [Aquipuribacter hungaricus]|uniref:Carboxypeptidase-like regulatory domain-containing protein n=1 Tax=Aquipuribacter hungaricus TaxID=545624 RepID=A0ABV7WKU7_9MICO
MPGEFYEYSLRYGCGGYIVFDGRYWVSQLTTPPGPFEQPPMSFWIASSESGPRVLGPSGTVGFDEVPDPETILTGGCGAFATPAPPPPTGAVVGTLQLVGGPPGVSPLPVPGEVAWPASDGGQSGTTPTDADGQFRLELAPGRYGISATSPGYMGGRVTCQAAATVVITAGNETIADIACPIR